MPANKSVQPVVRVVATALLLASAIGCSYRPSVYAPNALVQPMFDSAGQASIGGTIGTSSYGAQLAWSPLQHLYVHANVSGFGEERDSMSEHAWHSFAEAGIGGYLVADEHFQLDAGLAYGRGRAIGNGRVNCWFCNFPAPDGDRTLIRESGRYGRARAQMSLATTITRSTDRRVGLQSINAVRLSRVTFDELIDETTIHNPDTMITSRASRFGVARTFVEFSFGGRLRVRPISFDLLMMVSKGLDAPSFDVVSVQIALGMSLRIDELLEFF